MRTLTVILFVAAVVGSAKAIVPTVFRVRPDSTIQFPKVEGSNLEGRRFYLPTDFGGDLNIVLVAFRRAQQNDVDTWVPFLKQTSAKHSGLRAYELPTLNRSYRMVRGFIDGGMARGIPEKATRETTITLYIDKAPFKKTLGITTEDRIVTLLVARDGRVLWRADGRHSAVAAANLASEIDRLMPAGAPLSFLGQATRGRYTSGASGSTLARASCELLASMTNSSGSGITTSSIAKRRSPCETSA